MLRLRVAAEFVIILQSIRTLGLYLYLVWHERTVALWSHGLCCCGPMVTWLIGLWPHGHVAMELWTHGHIGYGDAAPWSRCLLCIPAGPRAIRCVQILLATWPMAPV